ncbi:MAG: ankyrin repeat domain-containing protein [Gammaproteobacteria bacterium]|nr:ankyrin repeat domain-containing protein [Gammaproteobacteria bacterium]
MRKLSCLTLVILCLLTGLVRGQSMPPLVEAARTADWDTLSALLKDGADTELAFGDGTTALHWVSYHDNITVAAQLIAGNAIVNARTDLGVTPLWLASENGSIAMTRLLLEAGADPSLALLSGESPLMTASLSGNADVVRLLLAAGANPNIAVTRQQTPLMWAARQGHAQVVEALVEYGADVAARTEIRTQYVKTEKEQDSHPAYKMWIDEGGYTPLMFAASAGDLSSARALIAGGSDVNAWSAFGLTPAIMAVHGGNAELLELLLQAGAAVDLAPSGHTPLHAAVLRGNLQAVKTLLAHGADPDKILEKPTPTRRQSADYHFHDSLIGATPLWLAARFSEPAIMRELIEGGADPEVVNNVSYPAQRMGEFFIAEEGEHSLLMAAVGMGNRRLRISWGTSERRARQVGRDREALILEACQVAVLAGVDINLRDATGQSALDFAKARRYERVVDFLQQSGAI